MCIYGHVLHAAHIIEPPPVLKARHLSGSAFCWIDRGLPKQAMGGFPLGLGLVVEDRPTAISCNMHVSCARFRIGLVW